MLDLEPKDWIQLAVWASMLVGAVAVIKNDIKWLVKWSEQHQKSDDEAYASIKEDIREIRDRI